MKGLIQALNIFLKYGDKSYPTHCEHDDIKLLEELGFSPNEYDGFSSFRYGSC